MSHKFKIGQHVRQLRDSYVGNKSIVDGLFEIVRLTPDDRSDEPTYRIRSAGGERAMREGELTHAS
ncbi:hypothetical protein MKK88_15680 [Methylobacterium sp. E-005]|uniref:hypothetical protein n=1 Tax=Methylobacterium sp. E-005 TaxID=2836549 RepID=UPI001FBBEE2C|nr:hypothetical protein [Methylobacterium sp. E-005]MCJ2087412.1 hypothetical protein [Methylobacterium sp. E-005]